MFLSLPSAPLLSTHQTLLIFPSQYFLSHSSSTPHPSSWLRPHERSAGLLQQPGTALRPPAWFHSGSFSHRCKNVSKRKSDHVGSLHKSLQLTHSVPKTKPRSPYNGFQCLTDAVLPLTLIRCLSVSPISWHMVSSARLAPPSPTPLPVNPYFFSKSQVSPSLGSFP